MGHTSLSEQINHIFEELKVPPLVRGDGNSLGVFFDRRVDNLVNRAIVPQVNHLYSTGLKNTSHNIYRCIMAIEERCGRHHPNGTFGFVDLFLSLHLALLATLHSATVQTVPRKSGMSE